MIKKIRQLVRRRLTLSLLLVAIIFNVIVYFFTPNFPPENVRITNVTDTTISISWTTSKPTSGFVAYNQQPNKFLRTVQFFSYQLPILAKYCFNIGADEIPDPSYAHHVTLKNLTADTAYYYRIASGWRLYKTDKARKTLPDIKTGSVLETLSMPQPIFSRVFQKDSQTGAPNVLVYLTLIDLSNSSKSNTISAVTDIKGIWNADLGNFRSPDLKTSVNSEATNAQLLLVVKGGKFGESYSIISPRITRPTNFVNLK